MLEKIQKDIFEKIVYNRNSLDFIKSSYSQLRISFYRNTIFENLRSSLEITFPGVWKILGKECADSCAYAFCKDESNLPRSGCLSDWGEGFPQFIANQEVLKTLLYLKDYALYEWLKNKAYEAADAQGLYLSELSEQEIQLARILFIPSLLLFDSQHPIAEISNMLNDGGINKSISQKENNRSAIIYRQKDKILISWITKDLWLFLFFLKEGDNILQSAKKVFKTHSSFDLTSAFAFLMQNKLIDKISF